MNRAAKVLQRILNQIRVGRVFTVEDHTKARLDTRAKI
jgi:hypothetical protein